MNRKILFDVTTPFQLLIASAITKINYKHDITTILLNNAFFDNVEELKQRIIKSVLFSNVFIINEIADKNIITDSVDSLELENTDIFHFSSYSSVFSCYLYNKLIDSAQVILDEEGMGTYNLYDSYAKYRALFPDNISDSIDLTKLSKILVSNKELYISNSKEIVQEINYIMICEDGTFVDQLNIIFNYKFKEIAENNIFFTQNFLDYNVVTEYEIELFYRNVKDVYGDDIIFKLHPFDKNHDMYKKLNIKTLESYTQIPWEVIMYNLIVKNKFFNKSLITIGSSILSSSSLYLKHKTKNLPINHVILTKLFYTPFNDSIEILYANLRDKTDFSYSLPESFTELKNLIQ